MYKSAMQLTFICNNKILVVTYNFFRSPVELSTTKSYSNSLDIFFSETNLPKKAILMYGMVLGLFLFRNISDGPNFLKLSMMAIITKIEIGQNS